MFSGLFIILLPLVVGYLLPLRHSSALKLINRMLSWIVYVILFFMGISLAFLDNLASNLLAILHYAAVSVVIILLCNIAALLWLESKMPWRSQHRQEKLPSRLAMALESLQLCGVVVLGFLLGLTRLPFLQHATEASEYTLIFLLFLVGIQLRNNGMSLRQIVLNRRGMIVAVVVTASSLLGGILNAFILGLPLKTGLAMASGFGWYSLSGILLTESFGPVIGSAAFFNDLCRELLAIMLIPGLIRRSRSTALGLCGATLQGVFQNPLVDPHIIGVTAGSAFGGTLAILLGVGSLLMMASTFFFGLVALGLIYALAALQGRDSTLGLILSGIILSGFFAALVSLMQYLADSEETLPNIVFWLLGSFATASWHKVLLMSLPLAVAAGALWKLRWRINLLALEERDARSLGVPVAALRRGVLVCCAVLVAAQVAVSGSIAWMGLVVPHLARLLVGADHRRLLPTAFWLGAALMLVVDDLARTLTQAEIPIGIITALLGAPLFTVLLVQSRRRNTLQ